MIHAYISGLATCLLVTLMGCTLQFLSGGGIIPLLWEFPLNLILLFFIVLTAAFLRFAHYRSATYQLLKNPYFSIGALSVTLVLVLISGLFMQQHNSFAESDSSLTPFSSIIYATIRSWPFILNLVALLFILSIVILGRPVRFSLRYVSFQLNHIGLWLLLGAGVMGAADKKELRTILTAERPTTLAFTTNGNTQGLPFELSLEDFYTEHFPNKLMVIEFDTLNGSIRRQAFQDLLAHTHLYSIEGYEIEVEDGNMYSDSLGVKVGDDMWMLHVDYNHGFAPLHKDKALLLNQGGVKRYVAKVAISSNKTEEKTIETLQVNHPMKHAGYYIYLDSYTADHGVVLRLVADSWLWMAYLGLWSIIAGALLMFVSGPTGFVYATDANKAMNEPTKTQLS